MKDRGVKVVGFDYILGGFESEFISGAVDGTSLDSATRHPNRESVGIMITAEL